MVLLGCGVMQFQNGVLLEVSLDPHLHSSLTSFWHKSQQRAAQREIYASLLCLLSDECQKQNTISTYWRFRKSSDLLNQDLSC